MRTRAPATRSARSTASLALDESAEREQQVEELFCECGQRDELDSDVNLAGGKARAVLDLAAKLHRLRAGH